MQVGGDVAKTIRFKNGEEGVEYSLEELFSMIFEPEGLSNLLKTSIEITENGEQKSLPLNTVLNDIVPLTKSLEDDVKFLKKSKPIALSTNEFDDSKLPSKIYYKVLEPEWTANIADKSQSFEVSEVSYTAEEKEITVRVFFHTFKCTVPAGSYYTTYTAFYNLNSPSSLPPLQEYTLDKQIVMIDENGKSICVSTERTFTDALPEINGNPTGEAFCLTTFRYEDGSPVEAPLTLYPKKIKCYDFENLQFTTEAKGNTLLGDVYTYLNEWGGRNYTLYPDYTPNIAEGQSAINLAISDPENMRYSIKLEALFNGGYTFSLGNKEYSYLGGVDVVADGDGTFTSGRKMFVIGNGASGFGVLNKVRARNATAFGYNNTVTGINGIAFNEGNKVLGYASMGVGDHNTVVSNYSFGGGAQNKIYGYANFGYGIRNLLNGNYLYVFGVKNTVEGDYHGVFGRQNIVKGKYHIIQGFTNTVDGSYITINGNSNNVSGRDDLITGKHNTVNSTGYNEVVGGSNNVNGSENFVIGFLNYVTSVRSMVAGSRNTVNENYCLVSGLNNEVKARFGSAIGTNLIVNGRHQLVIGSFNEGSDDARFIVGNGGSDTNRSNAFVVKNDGRAVLGADPEENMDAVTKQYLDKALKNYVGNDMIGDIESALDAIIQIQNGIIGGETL